MTLDNNGNPFVMIYLYSTSEIVAFRASRDGLNESILGELNGYFGSEIAPCSSVYHIQSMKKRLGIGREMMLFFEELSEKFQSNSIYLSCAGGKTGDNFKFYLHLGYEQDHTGIDEDVYVSMVKNLELHDYFKNKAEEKHHEILQSVSKETLEFIDNSNALFKYYISDMKRKK